VKVKLNRNICLKALIISLFIIYIIMLFKIILFKGITIAKLFGNYQKLRSINVIPFKTMVDYFTVNKGIGFLRAVSNVFGNLIVFIPLGYFLPTINKRFSKFKYLIITVISFSLFFEVMQYILGIGSSDVDDLILNTIGGIIGYILYRALHKLVAKEYVFNTAIICATVLFFAGSFFVAKKEFGLYLGIDKLDREVIGGSEIPKRKGDIIGFFIAMEGNSITVFKGKDDGNDKDKGIFVNGSNVDMKKNDRDKVNILLSETTKVFSMKAKAKDKKLIMIYEKLSIKDLEHIGKESLMSIWGEEKDGKFIADTVLVTLTQKSDAKNTNEPPKVDAKNTIPSREPDLDGHIKSINGDEIIITRIMTVAQNSNSKTIVSTDIKDSFRITKNTSFIVRNIYEGGKRHNDKSGSLSDLKIKSQISVWGQKEGDYINAEFILINIVN